MGLSASDRVRYARQLLLPQLGEAGQERLLAAELRAPDGADPGALEVARAYLERAGVRVRVRVRVREREDVSVSGREDLRVAALASESENGRERAGTRTSEGAGLQELALYTPAEIARMAGDPALAEAARALAGALAAMAAIRKLAGLPDVADRLPIVALSSEDP